MADWLRESLARSLRFDAAHALRDDAMTSQLLGWTTTLLWAVVPFGAAMAAFAIVSALAMGGWTWTLKPLGPKFHFLDPLSGLGRVFSKQQVIDALKASVLALVLGTIGAFWLSRHVHELVGVLALPLAGGDRRGDGDGGRGDGLILLGARRLRQRRRAAAEAPARRAAEDEPPGAWGRSTRSSTAMPRSRARSAPACAR